MFKKTTTRAELIHKDTGRRADADSTTYRYPGGWLFISRNRLYHWNKNRGEESVALIGVQLEVNGTGQISKQFSAGRMLALGVLGASKKVDDRKLYLVVQGTGGCPGRRGSSVTTVPV